MSKSEREPVVYWRWIYTGVLVWLVVMIVLMRLLTKVYA